MRKIIINADDLGISDFVNNQIERCIELGVITSSSLMSNAPSFENGVLIAQKYSQISVGVHLNIIEFAPITNAGIFRRHGMLDKNGNFIDGAAFVVMYDDELKQAVYEEWDAQIAKIENAGLIPTHCDSHQHTHTIEALQDVLCKVMDKHNIVKVRRKYIPSIRLMLRKKKQPSSVCLDKSNTIRPKQKSVAYRCIHLFIVKFKNWNWNRKMKKKYVMTDDFHSFRDFYSYEALLDFSENMSLELMCHPGNHPYQSETDSLMTVSSWKSEAFELISYQSL